MSSNEQDQPVASADESENKTSPKPQKKVELESLLSVGTPATFQLEDVIQKDAPRYAATIRGWYKGRYILLDYPPASTNFDRESRVNATYVVRFMHEGLVCGFLARLHDEYKNASLPFFRFDWPKKVQTLPMRNQERIDIRLITDIQFDNGDTQKGTIVNLSTGGCNVLCRTAPALKTNLNLTFNTPGGGEISKCAAIVRNNTPLYGQFSVGCQFDDPHIDLQNTIELLVASQSSKREETEPDKPPVLIIDMGTEDCQPLRDALFMSGCESFVARSALEGLSALTGLQPKAILIGHAEGRAGEKEVCALLKDTRGMEYTPVIVYNIQDQILNQEGKQSSVLAYFNPDTPHNEIAQFAQKEISGNDAT